MFRARRRAGAVRGRRAGDQHRGGQDRDHGGRSAAVQGRLAPRVRPSTRGSCARRPARDATLDDAVLGRAAAPSRSRAGRRCWRARSRGRPGPARPLRRLRAARALVAVVCGAVRDGRGFEVVGRRAAASVMSDLRGARRAPAVRRPGRRGARARRARGARGAAASTRSRRTSRSSCRSSCSPRRPARDPRPVAPSTSSRGLCRHAAAGARVHGARRPVHRARARGALARRWAAERALPRRRPRAADASCVQPRPRRSRAHRRVGDATAGRRWATLRVAFLSGAVLELAATLGAALVAVTVGVRLAGGHLGLEAG